MRRRAVSVGSVLGEWPVTAPYPGRPHIKYSPVGTLKCVVVRSG